MEALLTAATQAGSPPEMPSPTTEGGSADANFHELVLDLMPSASHASASNETPKSKLHIGKDPKGAEPKEVPTESKKEPPTATTPIVLPPPQQQLTQCQQLIASCDPPAVSNCAATIHGEERSESVKAEVARSKDQQPSAETETSVFIPPGLRAAQSEPEVPADGKIPQASLVPSGNDSHGEIVAPSDEATTTLRHVAAEGLMAEQLPSTPEKPREHTTEPLPSILEAASAHHQHDEQSTSINRNIQPSDSAPKKVGKNTDNSETDHIAPAVSEAMNVKHNPDRPDATTQIDAASTKPQTPALNESYPPHSSAELVTATPPTHDASESGRNVAQSRTESIPQIQSADLLHRASNSELKVELKIAELGRVQVSASLHDENVHALVKIENSEARSVIAGEIGRADSAVSRHEIKVQAFGASSSADNNAQSQNRQPQTSARSYFPQNHAWKSTNPSITNVSSQRPVRDRGLDLLA